MTDPLDGLNKRQLEAVTHVGGGLLLVGGAGTGKTRALTSRFLWLVEQGIEPEAVLVLNHGTRAAELMRSAIEGALDRAYEELFVGTFDSFCGLLVGAEASFSLLSAADRLALLLETIDAIPLRHHQIRGNPTPLLASFLERIDRLKDQMISAEQYRRHAHSLAAGQAGALTEADRARADRELEFAAIYQHHDRLLRDHGAIDSGGLVIAALELLRGNPDIREQVALRFQRILVDDFQYATPAQVSLFELLHERQPEVTVAGDDSRALAPDSAATGNVERLRGSQPDLAVVTLDRSHRSRARILAAAAAIGGSIGAPRGRVGGRVELWTCASERAQAQAVAREADSLLAGGTSPDEIAVLVQTLANEGGLVASALEERGLPHRLTGSAAYFQRAEVRDVLAWLRLLGDPDDARAVVRALSRPPIGLRPVDMARLTQLARRRKLDMVAGVAQACEGPQLSPEGRDRAAAFLRLYRAAQGAFDEMPPDQFLHRLIERIGLRRNQIFAAAPNTVERLLNIAKLNDLATTYMQREPDATARDFARYLTAVAEAGLREDEVAVPGAPGAIRVMSIEAAKGLGFDHVFAIGLGASRGPATGLLHVAATRARESLVLSYAELAESGPASRPAPGLEAVRDALELGFDRQDEELFGPAEGLHSTFRIMRDEVLDSVARLGGRLADLRLDTYLDVSQGIARYLELVKLAALIERGKEGQTVAAALPEVNELLLQSAAPEAREAFLTSSLDQYLTAGAATGSRPRPAQEASLESFIPRRGDGLMLSASDIETYRICPLKYKFARVFRIPQEPTINQRFGIVVHQVLERFHAQGSGSLEDLMELFESSWRRAGFSSSNDDIQFHERAVDALRRYWVSDRERESEPVSFERGFTFKLGPHVLRGRVDRVDRLPDGAHELIDYKTGKPRTEEQLQSDIQLSIYQMGAREAWGLETSAQSYYYVLDNEKVPVEHSEAQLERVRGTVAEIAEGITRQDFEPTPSTEYCPSCDYRIICPAAEK